MTKVSPNEVEASDIPAKLTMVSKVCLVLICLGFLLVVIPSGFDGWLTYTVVVPTIGYKNAIRIGIFYACTDDKGCEPDPDSIMQWQYDAAYIYGSAMFVIAGTLVAMVIHCLKYSTSWAVYLKYIAAVGSFMSWVLVFASDFIVVANRDNVAALLPEFDIAFALVLSICGGVIHLVVNVILSIEIFFLTD